MRLCSHFSHFRLFLFIISTCVLKMSAIFISRNIHRLVRPGGVRLLSQAAGDGPVVGGFAEAFEKHSKPVVETKIERPPQPFLTLLKNSKFVDVSG